MSGGLVAKLVRLKWHFPSSLSGLFTSWSSSHGTRATAAATVDEPSPPSSSAAFAYEQAFHQTVGRPYGQQHMAKLRAEFESFVAEKGEEDGLRSLADFSKGRQRAEALIDDYVDEFMASKRAEHAREGAKSDLHTPSSMLEMAQLYLLAEDTRNCSEQAWGAARMAVYKFAERVHKEVKADWKLEKYTDSHSRINKLKAQMLAGNRLPKRLSGAWNTAQVCHHNYYDNHMDASMMDESLAVVTEFVASVDALAVDKEAKERLAKFKSIIDAEEEEEEEREKKRKQRTEERLEREKRAREVKKLLAECRAQRKQK